MAEADAKGTLAAPEGENSGEGSEQNQSMATGSAASADWVPGLPDELQKVAKAKGWKAPADAVKSYSELERFASKAVQDMTPEERERFYKRLGRPESPDGYELSTIILPKGFDKDPGADKAFKEMAHGFGLTKAQAKGIHEWAMKTGADTILSARQIMTKQKDEAITALRKEWGGDFDANLSGVQKLIRNFGDDSLVQFLNNGPGNDPAMLRFLNRVRGTMRQDTLEDGRVPARESPKVEPGGFDWTKVPQISGENRYGKAG